MAVKMGEEWLVDGRGCSVPVGLDSAKTDLAEDALTGEHLREETNDETHHGQTAVPGFCKINEAEAGR